MRVGAEARTEEAVCLHIAVSDIDIGIPPDTQQCIFDIFFDSLRSSIA